MSQSPYEGAMLPLPGPSSSGGEQPVAAGFPSEFRGDAYAAGPGPAGWSPTASDGGGGFGGSASPSHGLNVPVCRDISYGLTKDADSLDHIAEAADGAVRRIVDVWDGADAEEFRTTWRHSRRAVDEATTSLRTMRRLLDLAVDQQEEASRR